MPRVRELTRPPIPGDRVFVRTVRYGNWPGIVVHVSLNRSVYGVRPLVYIGRDAPDVVLVTKPQVGLVR